MTAFFRGAVPRVVFESARKAIPGDLDFCLQFLDIARDFPLTTEGEGGLVEAIIESIEKEMGPEEAAWARAVHEWKKEREEEEEEDGAKGKKRKKGERAKAGSKDLPTRNWADQSGAQAGVKACLAALETGVDKCPQSEKMFSFYLRGEQLHRSRETHATQSTVITNKYALLGLGMACVFNGLHALALQV